MARESAIHIKGENSQIHSSFPENLHVQNKTHFFRKEHSMRRGIYFALGLAVLLFLISLLTANKTDTRRRSLGKAGRVNNSQIV